MFAIIAAAALTTVKLTCTVPFDSTAEGFGPPCAVTATVQATDSLERPLPLTGTGGQSIILPAPGQTLVAYAQLEADWIARTVWVRFTDWHVPPNVAPRSNALTFLIGSSPTDTIVYSTRSPLRAPAPVYTYAIGWARGIAFSYRDSIPEAAAPFTLFDPPALRYEDAYLAQFRRVVCETSVFHFRWPVRGALQVCP